MSFFFYRFFVRGRKNERIMGKRVKETAILLWNNEIEEKRLAFKNVRPTPHFMHINMYEFHWFNCQIYIFIYYYMCSSDYEQRKKQWHKKDVAKTEKSHDWANKKAANIPMTISKFFFHFYFYSFSFCGQNLCGFI